MHELTLLLVVLVLALGFEFLNGFHDAANVVATLIASRALSPRAALLLAACGNVVGPLLFGTAVATTIGQDLVIPEGVNLNVVMAALLVAAAWNLFTWWWGIPSSSSHALAGGLIGAALAEGGMGLVLIPGLQKVGLALLLSPVLGFVIGWMVLNIVLLLARGAPPKVSLLFNRLQLVTALALSLSSGTNDAQKAMGIIALALLMLGFGTTFTVPLWVILSCAGAMGLGTAVGGWRIIRTLGGRFYRIRPIHSLSSQIAAAAVIFTATFLGGPVSTTHVVSSAILGVGAAQRKNQVRWRLAGDIVLAWLITIPITLMAGFLCDAGLRKLLE